MRITGEAGGTRPNEPIAERDLATDSGNFQFDRRSGLVCLGSIRTSLPSVLHRTQTDASPKVSDTGWAGTSMRLTTTLVFGSMR
jgi:hypothetical protein